MRLDLWVAILFLVVLSLVVEGFLHIAGEQLSNHMGAEERRRTHFGVFTVAGFLLFASLWLLPILWPLYLISGGRTFASYWVGGAILAATSVGSFGMSVLLPKSQRLKAVVLHSEANALRVARIVFDMSYIAGIIGFLAAVFAWLLVS